MSHLRLYLGDLDVVANGTWFRYVITITTTRLLFAMGRRNLLDSRLAIVNARFKTPKVAVAFVGSITMLASLLGQAVLVPISEVGSLAAAMGFVGYIGAAVALALIMMKVVPSIPGSFGRYEYVALGAWIAVGFLLWKRR